MTSTTSTTASRARVEARLIALATVCLALFALREARDRDRNGETPRE